MDGWFEMRVRLNAPEFGQQLQKEQPAPRQLCMAFHLEMHGGGLGSQDKKLTRTREKMGRDEFKYMLDRFAELLFVEARLPASGHLVQFEHYTFDRTRACQALCAQWTHAPTVW